MENWEKAVEWILSKEGGYVNDPKDPGGETNFGISKRQFPEMDIAKLTKEDAKAIYKRVYWVGNNLDCIGWPYSAAALDSYVQHLPSVAKKMVERSNGDLRALLEERRKFYLALIAKKPELKKFKAGWLNRVNDLAKFCSIHQT